VDFFNPASPHQYLKDPAAWAKFVEYRASLVTRLHTRVFEQIARVQLHKPYLQTIVTFVDSLYETRMKEALGADVGQMRALAARDPFRLIVEDPASMWSLGPDRYSVLGQKYGEGTAGIDINVVERYQDVFPTKKQTGGEFLELFHNAAAAFSPVLVYFEASVLPRDMDFVAYALAAGARANGSTIDSPHQVFFHTNATTVDGQPWPARTGDAVLLPAGHHTVENGGNAPGFELVHFTGDLVSASYKDSRTINFTYRSTSRAIAIFSPPPTVISVDGAAFAVGESVMLPPGEHRVQAEQ
jgi:hypothetical protein